MKNKSLFGRLLDNKKLVIILSLFLSLIFWMISSDNTTSTITEVPISYNLSDSASKDLKIFSASTDKVTINVSGKRVIVDALSASDVTAYVDLFSVNKPVTGTYPVVVKNNSNMSFDIESIEPENITIMIDKEATKTVNIVSNFSYNPEGYYVENNLPQTVEITGPETLINKVKCAYVTGKVSSSDASTVTNTYTLRLFDSEDPNSAGAQEISTEYITMSFSSVDVSFRFMKIDENVPFTIKYSPSNIKLNTFYYTVSPSTISVAGPEELVTGENAIKEFSIDIGSLSKYKNQIYNETFNVSDILGDSFVNKSDGVETVKVQLDFSNFNMDTFEVSSKNIKVKNLPDGYAYVVPSTFAVSVVGTSTALDSLTENSFSIVYDFTDVNPTSDAPVDVPVSITVNSSSLCWVYRTSDTVSVQLSKAQ